MKPETTLINDWIENNGGARRFERGTSSNFNFIQYYLLGHGIEVIRWRGRYRITKPKPAQRYAVKKSYSIWSMN
jgi:hypothetical protein